MAFCSNCGKELRDGAKFCDGCGAPVSSSAYKSREQTYAGNVKKCPACGEEIPSFTAICPSCGHEVNSANVSSTMIDFTNQISRYDIAIANSPIELKKGWASWGKGKKIGWVILNIYTMCIPLVLYLLLPLLGIGAMRALTSEEKKKAQFINNYTFPNDRESILEGLFYFKGQMVSLLGSKIDRNTYQWIRIWKSKATQLFEKAEIMFKGDKIANEAYASILASEAKVKKSLLTRVIIVVILVGVFAVFVFTRGGIGKRLIESTVTFEWPKTGIALQIPEPPSNRGEITFNDDKNFWLEVKGVNQIQYEEYIESCKDAGFTVEGERNSLSYAAYNVEGYHLQLIHTSSDTDLTIRVEAPEPMENIQWPKSTIAKRIPKPKSSFGSIYWEAEYGFVIYIGNTSREDYKEYIDSVMDAGFTVDYKRGDDYFHASDKNGYKVDIDYQGNNVMFIRIDEPDK